ncbi:MAG: hypothetical protein IPL45_12240 [Actinomycetales bacterium]|nr:hypothetical protein [Actinomycetales bacterium]
MALFRKRESGPGRHPIAAFWEWWAAEGHHIDPRRGPSKSTDKLSSRVAAIHSDLAWHFGPGATSEHCLTVSAGGVAELRPVAERWLRAAPPADATWEFRCSQESDPEALNNVLEIEGSKVDLASTRFRVEPVPEELRVHVGVYHPAFGDLPEPVRQQVAYLVLDWLVGEDDVERWLGEVETLTEPPQEAVAGSGVLAAVAEIAAQRDPQEWAIAEWQDQDGTPGWAMYRRGLRWIDHPTLDRHQIVSVSYDAQDNGLPADSAALEGLEQLESELESLLGDRGILVAHETHGGVRKLHAYTDGEDQNIDAAVTEWGSRWHVCVEARADPAWSQVRPLTG